MAGKDISSLNPGDRGSSSGTHALKSAGFMGIAVFFSRKGIGANSAMVQKTAIFTTAIAILPLLLIWDGKLDRMDGVI